MAPPIKLKLEEHLDDLVEGDECHRVAEAEVLSNLLGDVVEGGLVSIPGSQVFELQLHLDH